MKDSLRNPLKEFKTLKTTVQGISSEDNLAMKVIFKLRFDKPIESQPLEGKNIYAGGLKTTYDESS